MPFIPNQKITIQLRNEKHPAIILAVQGASALIEYTYQGNHYLAFIRRAHYDEWDHQVEAWRGNPYGLKNMPKKWWKAMHEAGTWPTNAPKDNTP